MHIFYITFGPNERNHLQVYFSVFSILSQGDNFSLTVLTDKPEFYKALADRIEIVELNPDLLLEWQGEPRYFWRIKIKALEWMCSRFPGKPVIYLDSDTFFYKSPALALDIFREGHAFMHEDEGPLKDLPTKTARTMFQQLSGKDLGALRDLGGYKMWNAGVIGTPNLSGGKEIELALQLNDEFLQMGIKPYFIEQYAMSIAFQTSFNLHPADGFVAHYWSARDEWSPLISGFFTSNLMLGLSQQQAIERFRELDLSSVPEKRIAKNSKLRLKKLLDKWMTDKLIRYIGKER